MQAYLKVLHVHVYVHVAFLAGYSVGWLLAGWLIGWLLVELVGVDRLEQSRAEWIGVDCHEQEGRKRKKVERCVRILGRRFVCFCERLVDSVWWVGHSV